MLRTDCTRKLEQYLTEEGVAFRELTHTTAYTAQRLAEAEHIPGKAVAKVVVAQGDRGPCILVLPAIYRVDLSRAAGALGMKQLQLAQEREFRELFPDCEVGAMPPFGNLYDMPVYVDQSLAEDPEITFAAGSHELTLTVAYADFARLVRPVVADFARRF